jgi:hypothetical protein
VNNRRDDAATAGHVRTGDPTADINLALSLARDLTGQNDAGPDVDLLAACEAF